MDNGSENYRRYCDGDESGLAEIIKEYKDGLIFYISSIVGNICTAEDIAEETFILIGLKKPKDKGKGSFKTWLYTIGRNTAVDYIRKNAKYPKVSLENIEISESAENSLENTFLKHEQKITVHQAMRKLKSEHRQVLWLTYFEQLSNKETAMVMKKSVHSIENLLSRARKSLKSELEKENFDYEKL